MTNVLVRNARLSFMPMRCINHFDTPDWCSFPTLLIVSTSQGFRTTSLSHVRSIFLGPKPHPSIAWASISEIREGKRSAVSRFFPLAADQHSMPENTPMSLRQISLHLRAVLSDKQSHRICTLQFCCDYYLFIFVCIKVYKDNGTMMRLGFSIANAKIIHNWSHFLIRFY